MKYVVNGVGYIGRRVLARLPDGMATGIDRQQLDLDGEVAGPVVLPAACSLLYTVPPAMDSSGDPRLEKFLALIEPVPRRLLYLSTTGVYGDRQGATAREADPLSAATARAQRRVAAEALLRAWAKHSAVQLIILRIPGIYGPGRLGLERIRKGIVLIAEAEAGPANRIHGDDLAACCALAMQAAVPAGIYNVGDGDHRSSTWFTKTVARLAGLATPAEVSREEAERRFTDGRLSFLREPKVVDTTRMRAVLGFTPRYTNAEDGIRESLLGAGDDD